MSLPLCNYCESITLEKLHVGYAYGPTTGKLEILKNRCRFCALVWTLVSKRALESKNNLESIIHLEAVLRYYNHDGPIIRVREVPLHSHPGEPSNDWHTDGVVGCLRLFDDSGKCFFSF
jgi:hypothetical protein